MGIYTFNYFVHVKKQVTWKLFIADEVIRNTYKVLMTWGKRLLSLLLQ